MNRKKAIALDFDGVIHFYRKGWANGEIYDEPMPGAFEAIQKLLEKYHVFIMSTRPAAQIVTWITPFLNPLGIAVMEIPPEEKFWNGRGLEPIVGITNRKLAAEFYVDDRGIHFTNWEEVLAQV